MIHCRFGDAEGVSIVMQQIENSLKDYLKVSRKNIRYLIGNSNSKSRRVTEKNVISRENSVGKLVIQNY
jgi:predicted metal-binding transcription factor (methanogenesis marker protein 9)